MGRVDGGAELGCKSYNGGEHFRSRMKCARVKKNMHAFEMLAMNAGGGVGWGGVGCGWGGWGGSSVVQVVVELGLKLRGCRSQRFV